MNDQIANVGGIGRIEQQGIKHHRFTEFKKSFVKLRELIVEHLRRHLKLQL